MDKLLAMLKDHAEDHRDQLNELLAAFENPEPWMSADWFADRMEEIGYHLGSPRSTTLELASYDDDETAFPDGWGE